MVGVHTLKCTSVHATCVVEISPTRTDPYSNAAMHSSKTARPQPNFIARSNGEGLKGVSVVLLCCCFWLLLLY